MPIRVLDTSEIRDYEHDQQVPELVIVGEHALFEVQYDDQWAASGARHIDNLDVIRQAAVELAGLWAKAGLLAEYFSREIAPLPPPSVG